jgi:hypothetical protein
MMALDAPSFVASRRARGERSIKLGAQYGRLGGAAFMAIGLNASGYSAALGSDPADYE